MTHNTYRLTVVMALVLMAAGWMLRTDAQSLPPHVAGKIVSVSHEKVMVNNQSQDQITVTVESCQVPGQLKSVVYSPATVSDRTALGALYDETLTSARTANMAKQQMVNGFGLFWVDANNRVTRTGILGAKMDCSVVPSLLKQF